MAMKKPRIKTFLQSWAINTLAVLVACSLVPGIRYEKPLDLLVASLLLGILNAFVRPILMFLALPLLILTLGLFTLVINALLLLFVGNIMSSFHVDGFWDALLGAIIIGFISVTLNSLTGSGNSRIQINRRRPPPSDRGGNGPVIDV
jgi:putative membrane protein